MARGMPVSAFLETVDLPEGIHFHDFTGHNTYCMPAPKMLHWKYDFLTFGVAYNGQDPLLFMVPFMNGEINPDVFASAVQDALRELETTHGSH